MYHYFNKIENRAGEGLTGYFVRAVDRSTLQAVAIYSDENGTPISSASEYDNLAKTDDLGNVSFYVEPGTYNLDIYAPDATTFRFRVSNVELSSGEQGPPGEGLADVMAPTGSGLVGFLQQGSGATPRSTLDKSRESISVLDFGAVGDGVTDCTAAIVAADAAAAARNKILDFPAGSYVIQFIEPKAAHWRGEGRLRSNILYKGSVTTEFYNPILKWIGVDNVVIEGLRFDGNCSADPTTWTAANYNSFTGCSGPQVFNGKNARISNCLATNVTWSGFNFNRVTGGVIENTDTIRARGIFGDGVLVLSSTDVTMRNCNPYDYTRIGVCADRIGAPGELLCQRIRIENCNPSYGHNGSILYGGTEYSCGIWGENCIDVVIDGCHPKDNLHRGIVAATGPDLQGLGVSRGSVLINNCTARNSGDAGIIVESLGVPFDAVVNGCMSYGARFAFVSNMNDGADSIVFTGCHAQYDASVNNGRGFTPQVKTGLTGKPKFEVGRGCTVARTSPNMTFLNAIDPNVAITADVANSNNGGSAMRLTVTDLKATDGGRVYIRWHGSVAHEISINDSVTQVSYGAQSGGFCSYSGGEVVYANVVASNAAVVTFQGGKTTGNIFCTSDIIHYENNTDIAIGNNAKVRLISNSPSKFPAIFIGGAFHRKDVNAQGPIFSVNANSDCYAFLDGFKLYNKGSASETNAWIEFTGAGNFDATGVRADNTVTPIFSSGTSSFAGITKIPMR